MPGDQARPFSFWIRFYTKGSFEVKGLFFLYSQTRPQIGNQNEDEVDRREGREASVSLTLLNE